MTELTFNRAGYTIVTELPEDMRPWRDKPTAYESASPSTGAYHLDADGVYLYYPATGGPYDHPVGQIQFGLGCIAAYRLETDPARRSLFLTRAKTQADRLIAKRVEARGGWWFPYPFPFTHSVHTGVTYTEPPWYSGMAQGEALSLFVQLAELDGVCEEDRARYLAAADAVFATLQVADDGYPWAVNVDDEGFVWIQEYPANPQGTGVSDYTYNGMIFAMSGLWDYFGATGDPQAAALYDGCATTLAEHWPSLRNQRWFSYYCQTHRIPAPTYHHHHIHLFTGLHWQTGSMDFADHTDRLIDDAPPPRLADGARVQFAAGSHTLYRLDTAADGSWVETKADAEQERKTVSFSSATQAPATMRRRIQGRGVYYRISSGPYLGWWVPEVPKRSYLLGECVPTQYLPARTVTFPGGSVPVEASKVAADGTVTSTRTVTFANPSNAPAGRRAFVNGQPSFLITAGGLSGYWVPASSVTADSSGPSAA